MMICDVWVFVKNIGRYIQRRRRANDFRVKQKRTNVLVDFFSIDFEPNLDSLTRLEWPPVVLLPLV